MKRQSPSLLGRSLFTFRSKLYFVGIIWNTVFLQSLREKVSFFLRKDETVVGHCLGLIMFLTDILVV